jgi:hypothetical protein
VARFGIGSINWHQVRTLLRADQRLSTANLLKDSFGQFWSYGHEGWARRIFSITGADCLRGSD